MSNKCLIKFPPFDHLHLKYFKFITLDMFFFLAFFECRRNMNNPYRNSSILFKSCSGVSGFERIYFYTMARTIPAIHQTWQRRLKASPTDQWAPDSKYRPNSIAPATGNLPSAEAWSLQLKLKLLHIPGMFQTRLQ